MKAIICAAGEGKRLRPYTNEIPKCLLNVGNKTIIEYILNNISEAGIKDVLIVVGYKKEAIVNKIGNKYKNCKINYVISEEYSKADNMHSLWLAMKNVDEEIIFFNADILFSANTLKEMANKNGNVIAIASEIKKDSMKVKIKNGFVKELGKNLGGEVQGDAIGIYKLSKKTARNYFDIANEIVLRGELNTSFVHPINELATSFNFQSFMIRDKWAEIDSIEDYKKAKDVVREILN